MEIEWQGALLLGLATIIASLAIVYFRLKAVLSQTDQVLSVWEYIAETRILCNHVSRIFTMLMKVRNPFSQSIGLYPFRTSKGAGANFRFPDHVA